MQIANSNPKDCLTQNEVLEKQKAGMPLQIIDVRSAEEFEEQHIPGAVNVPLDGLAGAMEYLNKATLYVTACGKGGGRSNQGADILKASGFDAFWLCGGTFGWV